MNLDTKWSDDTLSPWRPNSISKCQSKNAVSRLRICLKLRLWQLCKEGSKVLRWKFVIFHVNIHHSDGFPIEDGGFPPWIQYKNTRKHISFTGPLCFMVRVLAQQRDVLWQFLGYKKISKCLKIHGKIQGCQGRISSLYHGWSTYPPLTYPPQKYGLIKGLLTIGFPS